ncbi:hypothetical protein B9479_005777 [Cryptococcus floricola]|uniref:GDP-Man:Man(3)GlcNAc(2)-PP-Dol alpha-1,2-mannosyltransferase n=1 Tax=Cryptococcus floricola TaxID=2591691 RepID=A0A5D3ATS6_9TREE|nr:hypothetical protein B9479_005777 [Cryptococcus floricola]
MDAQEAIAIGILIAYFGLIGLSFALVSRSIIAGTETSKLWEGRAFYFLRSAFGALLCTWYFYERKLLNWSYEDFKASRTLTGGATFGQWLVNTALFEQAWTIVCKGAGNWWWSSWICTWTILFTVIVWSESGRRGIKYPYAYMLLGQLVAMSVATALFLVALSLHPRTSSNPRKIPFIIAIPLTLAFVPAWLLPQHVGTESFMNSLLWLHGALLLPLISPAKSGPDGQVESNGVPLSLLYPVIVGLMGFIHIPATQELFLRLPTSRTFSSHLLQVLFSHPAQASVSLDVVWVALVVTSWFVITGPTALRIAKAALVGIVGALFTARYLGVNWTLIASIIPIFFLLSAGGATLYIQNLRRTNLYKRQSLMDSMGMPDGTFVQGTGSKPPGFSSQKTVVGFWHPFCNAGGGGERVLWVAIRHIQKTDKETMVLVYSGDYPEASKEEIIGKVKERFSIVLDPSRLHFISLRSRYLVSDGYWKHFTLMSQSLGSILLAWEGLCGKDGLWGDIFIDSMGYGLTYPTVRLIAGPDIAIGSYTHYPTVSANMVKRVKERVYGVENAGASKSWIKTQIKLIYYYIFTSIYSVSLLYAQHIMTNSSWTQAHIQSLLTSARSSFLASILLKDEVSVQKQKERGELAEGEGLECGVVYPPTDTTELARLGGLESRKREIVSLAQFRPEKDHAKQLYALSALFEKYPQYRHGSQRVTLALMGGVRDAGDQARLDGLKTLAKKLEIDENVEFVVSAPYPEIVKRLGQASLGINTMMDEHFGINVVEFMAAGLIPVVHASAGPLMDIVVPYNGQRTGFHATDADSFAEAIHAALSVSPKESLKMRKAARQLAVEKFSERKFEEDWDVGYERLREIAWKRK